MGDTELVEAVCAHAATVMGVDWPTGDAEHDALIRSEIVGMLGAVQAAGWHIVLGSDMWPGPSSWPWWFIAEYGVSDG